MEMPEIMFIITCVIITSKCKFIFLSKNILNQICHSLEIIYIDSVS